MIFARQEGSRAGWQEFKAEGRKEGMTKVGRPKG